MDDTLDYSGYPWYFIPGKDCALLADMYYHTSHGECRGAKINCAQLAINDGCRDYDSGGIIKRKMKTRRKKGNKKRKPRSKRRKTRQQKGKKKRKSRSKRRKTRR